MIPKIKNFKYQQRKPITRVGSGSPITSDRYVAPSDVTSVQPLRLIPKQTPRPPRPTNAIKTGVTTKQGQDGTSQQYVTVANIDLNNGTETVLEERPLVVNPYQEIHDIAVATNQEQARKAEEAFNKGGFWNTLEGAYHWWRSKDGPFGGGEDEGYQKSDGTYSYPVTGYAPGATTRAVFPQYTDEFIKMGKGLFGGEFVHNAADGFYGWMYGDPNRHYMEDFKDYIGVNNIQNPVLKRIAGFGVDLADPAYLIGFGGIDKAINTGVKIADTIEKGVTTATTTAKAISDLSSAITKGIITTKNADIEIMKLIDSLKGQNISDILKSPVVQNSIKSLPSDIQDRLAEAVMRVTKAENPMRLIQAELDYGLQGKGWLDFIKSDEVKEKANYILSGNKKSDKANAFIFTPHNDGYSGFFGRTPKGTDIIDYSVHDILNPKIGTRAVDNDLGPLTEYIAKNYGGKARITDVPSTDGPIALYENRYNEYVRKILNGEDIEGVVRTPEGVYWAPGDRSFNIEGGFSIDTAGHRVQYRVNPETGKLETRRLDVWKFLPDDYKHKWRLGSVHNPEVIDFGLNFINDRTSKNGPVVFRTPWIEVKRLDSIF